MKSFKLEIPKKTGNSGESSGNAVSKGCGMGFGACGGVLIFIIVLIVLGSLFSGGDSTSDKEKKTNSTLTNDSKDVAAEPEDPNPHFSDGTYKVGEDIEPGTYRTRKASDGCYFARLSGFGGSFDELVANGNTDGPAVVTIAESDAGFESRGCGTWTKDLSAITADQTTFGEGTYIVGTDIEPGTYRSSGNEGCYYARLSGFSSSFDDLIANNNTDTPAIVTISASDKGFTSTRCGIWSKQ